MNTHLLKQDINCTVAAGLAQVHQHSNLCKQWHGTPPSPSKSKNQKSLSYLSTPHVPCAPIDQWRCGRNALTWRWCRGCSPTAWTERVSLLTPSCAGSYTTKTSNKTTLIPVPTTHPYQGLQSNPQYNQAVTISPPESKLSHHMATTPWICWHCVVSCWEEECTRKLLVMKLPVVNVDVLYQAIFGEWDSSVMLGSLLKMHVFWQLSVGNIHTSHVTCWEIKSSTGNVDTLSNLLWKFCSIKWHVRNIGTWSNYLLGT